MKKIDASKWKWFGHTGHFICGYKCRFHLCTQVGKYLVSTVGDYFPGGSRERETIGCDRFFETMVFKAGAKCRAEEYNCGQPEIDGSEIDFLGYNDAGSAAKGHMKLCRKWAKK